METNVYMFFVAALVPLVIGAAWYNPMLFGNTWLKASGLTEEDTQTGNMLLIFGLTYLMGLFLAGAVYFGVVHQTGFNSLMASEPGYGEAGSGIQNCVDEFMSKFGDKHRSFGHGAFHGAFLGILFATPVIVVISLFERRSFKYIAVHAGYWILTLGIMGGLLCAFA